MSSSHSRQQQPSHPTPFTYVRVAFTLAVITGIEVAAIYLDLAAWAFIFIFFVLSAAKFALVVLFYMHLRYDARLFSGLFTGGLLLALAVVVSVLALFGVLVENPVKAAEEEALARQQEQATPTPTPGPETSPEPGPTPSPEPTQEASVELGREIYLSQGCGACHTISGLAGASGTIGPTHDGLATVAANRVSGVTAEEYIRRSIEEPNAFVVSGYSPIMPALAGEITQVELESLVAFLLTLK